MIAFKWLVAGGIAPFTGFRYSPGAWVSGNVGGMGIHACRAADLPLWISDELWRIELDGTVVEHTSQIEAERGRLLARVEGWRPAAFTEACVARARTLVEQEEPEIKAFADEVAYCAQAGLTGAASYITARAAAAAARDENAYLAERAWQTQWLVRELSL